MFAVLNIYNISPNAGRGLALTLQAFFMSAYIVVFRYWYSCTPVYRLNGRTAFGDECVKQRDRHGYLLFLLCVIFITFPTLHCLAATERQPTKPAHNNLPTTHTHTFRRWASTCRISLYASCANRMQTVQWSPECSTSAASAIQPEGPTSMDCFSPSSDNIARSASITASAVKPSGCAIRFRSSNAIRMPRYCRLISHSDIIKHEPGSGLHPATVGCTGLAIPLPFNNI